ncbi:hypothetical protein EW146_g1729 [Bondarzewia mesenterica]|uniref:Post-SET domain-containing protein n=1 Tax=Bondarzewia mesenterica TaxID=1095465 RepID=A0A4S4M2X6_9AGAM|nr:hypothetical protein EW146_g1729 [Bondarzewia mesenterica]
MKPAQESYSPSHPGLFSVDFRPGEYTSALIAVKDFDEGEIMAYLEGLTKAPKAYTSVQCGPNDDDHIELNSDLVYVNHSCQPNVAFDMSSPDETKWHARALEPIRSGEALTFFYPSTEWDMDQPFDCRCGAPSCLKRIQGAAHLTKEQLLARKFVSPWILASVAERGNSSTSTDIGSTKAPATRNCSTCGFGFAARGDDRSRCGCKPT